MNHGKSNDASFEFVFESDVWLVLQILKLMMFSRCYNESSSSINRPKQDSAREIYSSLTTNDHFRF